MKDRILEVLEARDNLTKEIHKIIGYSDEYRITPLSDWIDSKWMIVGDGLYVALIGDDTFDDRISYTISSLGAKGEQLFMGEKDGLTFVMGYPEDGNWEDCVIFILENKNKINGEKNQTT